MAHVLGLFILLSVLATGEMTDEKCKADALREGSMVSEDFRADQIVGAYQTCLRRKAEEAVAQQARKAAAAEAEAAAKRARAKVEELKARPPPTDPAAVFRALVGIGFDGPADQFSRALRALDNDQQERFAELRGGLCFRATENAPLHDACAYLQTAKKRPPSMLEVARLSALMDAGAWKEARAYVSKNGEVIAADGSSFDRRLDNGKVIRSSAIEACLEALEQCFRDRSRCTETRDASRVRCLREALVVTSNGKRVEDFTERYCGFVYSRFESAAAADVAEANAIEQELTKKAEAAHQLAESRKAATEQAMATLDYRRAVLAGQLCEHARAVSDIASEEDRMRRVDQASGTVNVTKRRQLAEARLFHEDESARLRREHAKLKGHPVKDWCREPGAAEVLKILMTEPPPGE